MTCWAGVAQHLDQMVNHWYDTPEIQNGRCSVFCGTRLMTYVTSRGPSLFPL